MYHFTADKTTKTIQQKAGLAGFGGPPASLGLFERVLITFLGSQASLSRSGWMISLTFISILNQQRPANYLRQKNIQQGLH